MDNRNTNKHKSIIKTIFFIIILIIIVFLFLRGCNKNIINDGIKIVDIKQSVDSFNNDTIFLNENLNKDKRYSYDITIHNYLDEDYYLYKVEIDNNFISYDKLLKLLKSNKDTKFRFNITPKKKINKKVKIKFYYGKLKEIKIGEDIVTFFGDEKVQLPLGEVKEGYRFLGYTDVEGSTKVKYEENKKYDIKDGTTLYPIYKEDKTASNPNTGTNSTSNNNNNTSEQPKENKKYIVTFDYQNGKEKTTKEVTYNEKYGTLPTAIKNGYAFTGWYLDDTKITSDSIVTITKDEILKAKYIIINYGISYDLQGGTVSSNPDSYTTESNDITLLNPSKSGYVFVGWTGSNGTTPEKNVVIKKGSTGSKNYKANFSANEIVNYKVIHKKEKLDGSFDIEEEVFSAPYGSKVKPEVRSYEGFTSPSKKELIVKEDGTSEIEYEYMRNKYTFTLGDNENVISSHTSGEYPYETSITLTAKEKNGYTFKKWSDGQTENPITFLLTEDISISPIYEANKYIVVFDSNTGIGTMPAQEMTYDQVQRLNLNAFTKVGNRFVGWNTKANGEGTAYLDGELVKNLVTEGSITLYAQYILEQYTISFDTDGGDELFNTTRTYGETYGTLPEAQKTGYTFIGWYLGDNKIESSTVVDITENITLKARYTIKNYNISYDLKDGSVSTANPQTYTVEDEFTLNNPSKQGYEFAGWTGTGLEGLTTSVKINKGTTEDLSFAANYTAGTATPYKVIHKYQNYNLTTYTEEEQSLTGVTGTTVYPQIRHKDGFIDPEVTSVQIKADGTTRLEYTYQRDSYTYSFDSNVTSSKEAGTYLYETEITVTPKEKAGYTFKEWEDETTSNPRTITLSSNTSVVPIYEANKYNVIFNSNTGTGSMPAQEMTYDAESNLIKNTFAKVGYTFVGWNTEDDGEGTPYSDEASVKNLAESENVILYAQWIANTNTPYKVIHKYQNLDLETYTEEVENKTGTTDAQVTPSVQSKTGFVNPSTQTVTINGNGLTEIIYTYNRETHTYALGNTTNVTSSLPTGNYPYGTEITITANEVPGYTFDKWSDNNTDNPREITLTDDITLSPIYTANTDTTYKVIHRYQNLDSTTYTEEVENKTGTTDTQVTPSVKSKTGFVNPSTQTVIINGNGLTEVIYNYTRETYTFTLEDTENVTSSVPAGNYPYGTEITLTANEIPGYTFDKWNDECTDNPRTITLVGNTTLKPTYTANTNTSYTVHHNKQNITLGGYVLSETDNLTGTTDTKVTPNVKDYEGFTAPVPTEVTIKGDGTTVVEYNYTRNEYTFTLNGAEDVVSTLPSGNYPYETSITLTAQAKVGYNFAGWSDGCEDNPRTISLVGNVELSPVYTNRTDTTYTVIYETMNLDGETYSEYRKDVLTGETGSKVTPEVITITGFTKPTAQEITIKADGTASLEYKYTRNKYSFAYSDTDDIDLDNSTPAGNYYYETEITVKAKEKEGYAFKDWSNGDSVNPTTFILDDAKTISAYYEANKYNVVFNANTGTGSMEDQKMTYDTESNLTKNTFIKEGYTFAGWNTDPYGEGTSYEDEAPVENLATSGNIILYAQWVEYPEANYTVYHYKQNLELDDYDLEYEEELSGITNAEVTPEVYDYEGFNSPETQTVTIAADGSTEVYYYYTRKMYTFEIENSEFISSSHENGEYPYETEIEINANEKEGYTFESWSNGETSNPLTIMLDSDIEITAIYSANTDTRYIVYHYKQNLELDDYDLDYDEWLYGTTGEEVTPEVYDYEGFNSPETQTVTIAADGSAEIYYYYTRKMYTFEIIDSEYVTSSHENGEYPYETEIEIHADDYAGYHFYEWSDGNGEYDRYITLEEDISLYPIYQPNDDTLYTVIHKYQNVSLDDFYDYEEYYYGTTDIEVTPGILSTQGFIDPELKTIKIAGDGSAYVEYYYYREMYDFNLEYNEYVHSSHENGEYPYETEIEINADEIPRYTFMRWSDGNTDNPRMITLDEDMNISAEYHLTEPYEVTFDSNGGEGDMDSLIYERDTTYNLPSNEFTNSGYIFAGWNTESDGTGIDYYDGESVINITEEDSVTLYALWAEEQYVAQIGNDYYTTLQKAIDAVPTTKVETTVKLLKDTSETITIANTKNVVLNLQNLTLSNSGDTNVIINNGILKIYNGNITSDASQGVINNNSGATLVMSGGRIIMTGNKQGIYNDGGTLTISGTAYIRSDSNQRAVIHNKSNGTVNITGGEIVSTQHYAIYNENGTMNIGTKDGIINNETPIIQGKTYGIVANSSYNFYDGIIKGITNPVGKTSNTGNTPTVSLDTNETKINELENNSAKIHGTEEIDSLTYKTLSLNKDSITYKITFDANGGNSSVSEKTVIITESIGELPTPTREGYTFIGWFENLLTGVKIESSYIPTSDMTLIAKYYKSIENATITPSKIIIDVGEEETINVTNIEEEYSFRSINPEVATVDQSGKVTGVSKGTTTIEITGSTSGKTATISVKVLQNHYTISFETDGGTPVEDIRIEQGESIGNLPETKKKGYTFDGWYKESTYNTKIDSSYTPTEDTRLYALWIMNPYPTFKTGSYINAKMKQLAGQSDADYSTSNSSITSILRSETKPNDSVLIDDNIVSTDDSIIPIYMWYEDNTIYYYSDAITIYLNPDSSHMFQYVTRLTNLDSSSWDTSKVTDMSWMFCECQFSRSLDLSNFDTRNVTDMRGIFSDCWYLQSLNISTWNTSKVTNMLKMFWNCSHIKSLDLSSFDTRNVTEMSGMFASCNELTYLNLSSFDTRNVTRMYNMFIYCNKLTILDLSSFDTSNVEDMGNMFYSCKELTTIYASDKFVTDKVYSENVMFGIANKIVGGAGTTYNPSKIGTEYARIDDPDNGKPGYFTSKNKKYTMFKDGNTVNNKMKQLAGTTNTNADSKIVSILRTETKPDDSILIDDNKVSIEGSAYPIYMWYDNRTIYYYSEAETLYLNQDSSYMFYFLSSLTTIDISNLDTSKVINMSDMFSCCESLTTLDLSSFDTSNVTNMSYMFQASTLLRNLNLSNFDTSKVESMTSMFKNCESLTTLDLSSFDTRNVTNMYNMFNYAVNLKTIYVSDKFVTNIVSNSGYMFYKNTRLVGGSGTAFDDTKTDKEYARIDDPANGNPGYFTEKKNYTMFKDGKTVNTKMKQLSGQSTANYATKNTKITSILRTETKPDDSILIDDNIVSTDDSIIPIYMWYDDNTIYYYSEANTIYLNPDSSYMFYYFQNVGEIDTRFDTSKVTDMSSMFRSCSSLTTLDLKTFDTRNVTDMSSMFSSCSSLTTLDLKTFDTRNVTDMSSMFSNCSSLTTLDISSFNTGNVTDMSSMFSNCSSLTTLDLKTFNTGSVTNMEGMFAGCISLTALDISSFNTSKVKNMSSMFYKCSALTSLNISTWDTSKVTTMAWMFKDCSALTTLDLSKWNSVILYGIESMFENCSSLTTLDLSGFDTRNVTDMSHMFYDCSSLTTIYVSDKFITNKVFSSSYMFFRCSKIVGGAGTTYDALKIKIEYARIDDPANGNPGYFTEKIANNSNSLSENSSPKRGVDESNINSSESVIKTITFNSNGGIGDMVTQEFDINSDIVININTFTNTGEYEFIGWNTEPDGTGIGYTDGDTILSNTYNDNIILYAQWQIDGWVLINKEYIDTISLEEQEWAYYNHGVRIENGFHVLPDLSGTDKLYNISNGIAQLGWIEDQDNNWFYFSKLDTNGDGYIDLDAYVDGDYIIDEITYRFDENGICLNHDGSSLSASVSTFTNNNFKIPLEAYSLRRYFMGIVY